jgi:TetR/AcrR family tetracycline transcriptional repressor
MVVEAALAIDPAALTLQAVADRLGVARKAVSHYVSSREELLALTAARALADDVEQLEIPVGDWRAAVRAYADGMRRALLRQPVLLTQVVALPGAGALEPVDRLVARLLAAGFDAAVAAQVVACVHDVVYAGARDTALRQRLGGDLPSVLQIRRVLAELPSDRLTGVRQLLEHPFGAQAQADFAIEVVIAGVAALVGPAQPPA